MSGLNVPRLNKIVLATSLLFLMQGIASAQTPAPAATPSTTPAPAASTATPATSAAKPAKVTMSAADKAALSKKCSADADAKGLKGKARKKFRSDCKKGGA